MALVARLKSYMPPSANSFIAKLQRLTHSHSHSCGEQAAHLLPTNTNTNSMVGVDPSRWRKVDSRALGIKFSMISEPSRIVLKVLQNQGHDAYLVGGCVRDLCLNKIPKDFDVITTAKLVEIKKHFNRAFIVGRRFPICVVYLRGSTIEVSSFETVAAHSKEKQSQSSSEIPKGFDAKDFMLWKNSLHRDFTINSLFFDPFAHKVYDYSNGISDLTSMKLRTLVPARLSFEQDAARILRGLRIAARLGLSFVKDTEKAICSLSSSIKTLDKGRVMMEMNYMLSYGASQPSLILLKRFNLLELLLPFHCAYLTERFDTQVRSMLMKLFFNLDKVVSSDHPCSSGLWVSLLAFHLALVNNPQDALVVWTFSSVLYRGNWKEGVKAGRKLSAGNIHFTPEISNTLDDMTDKELAQRVSNFSSIVIESIDALIDSESLSKVMAHYTSYPDSNLVFISKNAGRAVKDIFDVMVNDLESLSEERHNDNIDYKLLGKGDLLVTRFVLGKIIMDTMRSGIINNQTSLGRREDELDAFTWKVEEVTKENLTSSALTSETPECKVAKRVLDTADNEKHQQGAKKQKLNKQTSELEQKVVKEKLEEVLSCKDIARKRNLVRKVVVKDVKKLISLQEKGTLNNAEAGARKHCEAEDIHYVSGNVSKSVEQLRTPGPKEIIGVVERIHKTDKQQMVQTPKVKTPVLGKASQLKKQQQDEMSKGMLGVVERIHKTDKQQTVQTPKVKTPVRGKASQLKKQQQDEMSKGMLNALENIPETDKQQTSQAPEAKSPVPERAPELKKQREGVSKRKVNVLNLSDIFNGVKHPVKEDVGAGKQPTAKDEQRDSCKPLMKTKKLSSIFK